jgi:expansin (peptidoglycan-binding protein)
VIARLLSPRWLATGGAVVLAGAVAVAVLLRSPACAAPPTTSPQKGKATYYDLAGTKGNCSFAPPADDLYVALGPNQYAAGAACGGYLDVTGPKGKVRVKVFDSCPECGTGHLDLSRTAFKRIGNEIDGIIPITYKALRNPRTPGPLSITFVAGTSRYYWAVVIDNHANPLKSVKTKGPGGSWMTASRTDYNTWIINRDVGNGPFSVRMTDIYSHVGTATNIKLIPNKRQTTSVRLTGAASAPAAPVKKKAHRAVAKATPSPLPSPSASASIELAPTEAQAVPEPAPVDLAAAQPKRSCS